MLDFSAALGAVFLCLLIGGLGFAVRDGLGGERIKAWLRSRALLGAAREWAWRNLMDRALPIGGLAFGAPLALAGAGWLTVLAALPLGLSSAVNGHGIWAGIGRQARKDESGRGSYIAPLLRLMRITDETVGMFWRDVAGMTIRGWEYGAAVAALLWIDGASLSAIVVAGLAIGPLHAAGWALGWRLYDRGWAIPGFIGWRMGATCAGALISCAVFVAAALG